MQTAVASSPPARRAQLFSALGSDRFGASLPLVLQHIDTSRRVRLGAALMTAVVDLIWLDWWYLTAAMGALLFHEFVTFPKSLTHIIQPMAARDPRGAHRIFAACNFLGACLYAALWAPVLTTGDIVGAFVAAGWFWGSLVHNTTYFSRDRLLLVACMVPPVACAVVGPFLMNLAWWGPWVALYLTVQGLVAMLMAAGDRNTLASVAERHAHAREEAEQASVAKSQFLATMSHELRTPLNAIIGYAEIVEEDLEHDSALASPDDARRIRRAARHLLTLINEVLDLSKIESGRLDLISEPVDVQALLREVEETVRPIGAGNGNLVTLDLVGDVPALQADSARLKQCLLNLATNACKFTRDGRVTIRAGLETRNGASALEISVIDTGVGIRPEDQARLFQPFVQVDGTETRKQDGTGLGLVITRKLAQAMGGDVTMISSAGLGSTFTLRIPAVPVNHAAQPGYGPNIGPSVLVIEDDATARDITCRALSRLSFNVRATPLAAEGLALIEESRPDLVILDIHLPDMPGWSVLERIKTMPGGAALPVLVVTVDDDRQRALALGACEHMVKPVDRDRLTAAAVRFALPKLTPVDAPAQNAPDQNAPDQPAPLAQAL